MKNVIFSVPLLALCACGQPSETPARPVPPVPAPSQDTCEAAQHVALVGQDVTALERVLLIGQVRVIRPGQAVTQDFRPDRINFNIDSNNTVSSINCG